MKKILLAIMLSMLAFPFTLMIDSHAVPSAAFLRGKTPVTVSGSWSNTNLMTDGNDTTKATISGSGVVRFNISPARRVTGLYFYGDSGLYYKVISGSTVLEEQPVSTSPGTAWKSVNYGSYTITAIEIYSNTSGTKNMYEVDILADVTAPANVYNLKVVEVTENSIKISFRTPTSTDFNRYKIYRNNSLIYTSSAGTPYNTDFQYTLTGLSMGTTYTIKVTTEDTSTNESDGATINVTTLSPILQEVSQIVATPISDSQIRISWQEPEGDPYFNGVEIQQLGGATYTVSKGTTEYIVTGLLPSTRYDFIIRSVSPHGMKSNGQAFHAVTLDVTQEPPPEIKNLQSFVFNDRIKFTWENPENADHHEVRIYRNGVQIATAVTPANQFTDYGLLEHTTYTFVFYTVTTDNRKSEGISVTETTKGKPRGKVSGIQVFEGDQSAYIYFNKHDEETNGYAIYLDGSMVDTFPSNSGTITDLENDRTYTLEIAALNEWGESEKSDPITFTPYKLIIKTHLFVKSEDQQAILSWAAIDEATEYIIYRDGVEIARTIDIRYIDVGLNNGTEYTYQVSAIVSGEETEKSNAVTVKPEARNFDFSENVPEVVAVLLSAFSFAGLFAPYIIFVLGLILAATIVGFIFWLVSRSRNVMNVKAAETENESREPREPREPRESRGMRSARLVRGYRDGRQ